ncbi:MAG: glycosyltransferase family 2 protein [Candidatus Cloacimonetes bacterium]|nr:glycosyltransferase family 2 protein [Candidatus Cloacimonadota bacterium]
MNNSKTPKVTVLISTKNRETLVTRAINSVLAQTFLDFELIIADVSDNDLTQKALSDYTDPRVIYRRITNELFAARTVNSAVENARGKYIAFCDDDDEWSSNEKLAKQVALLDKLGDDYGFVACAYELWNDRTNSHIKFVYPKAKGMIFIEMLKENVASGMPALLIRRDAYLAVGGFEEGIKYSADYLLQTKLSKSYKFDFIPEVLVLGHTQHEFGSQQNLVKSNCNYRDKMEYFECFLKLFASDYQENLPAKKEKIETLITLATKSGDLESFIKYMKLYCKSNGRLLFIVKRGIELTKNISKKRSWFIV